MKGKRKHIPNCQVISRDTAPCRSVHSPYPCLLTQDTVRTRQDPWSGLSLFQVIARLGCDIKQVVCLVVVADSAASRYSSETQLLQGLPVQPVALLSGSLQKGVISLC